jgi:hypothetical protein
MPIVPITSFVASPAVAVPPSALEIPSPLAVVRPPWQEVAIIFTASLQAIFGLIQGDAVPKWINLTVPLMLTIGLATGAAVILRRDRAAIWAPLIWLRAVMIAYSGVGSIVPFFANNATLDILDSFFKVYPRDMIGYNAVVAVFTLIILVVNYAMSALAARRSAFWQRWSQAEVCAFDARQFGFIALAIAMPFKIVFEWFPFYTGVAIHGPATVAMLSSLSWVAYPLLIAYYMEVRPRVLLLVGMFIFAEFMFGVLTFNKTTALAPLIFSCLGVIYQRVTTPRLLGVMAVIVLAYSMLTPITSYGRAVDYQDAGFRDPEISRSIKVLQMYQSGGAGNADTEAYQGSWARLTYITGGSFAVSQYNRGLPGNTLQNVFVVLIPRVFYPDKPNMTQIFSDFNLMLTGSDQSQSSPGVPAEAYWDFGWLGVAGFAIVMGLVYTLWSAYSIAMLRNGAWHLLFVALIGIRTASRIDGLFATDFVPMVVIGIIAHLGLSTANRIISGRRRTARRQVRLANA